MANRKNHSRNFFFGAVSMLAGTFLVLLTLVVINKYAEGPKDEVKEKTAKIDFQKKEKPKPKQIVKQQPPPKPQPRSAPPNPLQGLDSSLSGLDVGIPSMNAGDLGDLSKSLLGDSQDVVMDDSSVDQPPQPVRQTPMTYPPRAKAQGIEGYVTLSLLISRSGAVEQVKVLESQPSGVFDDVAAQGVKSWQFEPAQYQGQAVKVWARQKVRFDLS